MKNFLRRYGPFVRGVLSGWDRLRLRGTLRWLANVQGMLNFLWHQRVLLKDFGAYAEAVTGEIRKGIETQAEKADRRVVYLASSRWDKEQQVRQIAARDKVREGLIAVLKVVEPCWSVEVHRNREKKHLELRGGQRKCLHYYHYYLDPDLGFFHARLQTWFPFTIHVCLNGREWLGRQLQKAKIGYEQRENCFVALADVERAQALMDKQLQSDWPALLDGIAARINPAWARLWAEPLRYYWSADQSEWATDILFRSAADLRRIYPSLVWHSLRCFGSRDVMRFLSRRPESPGYRFQRFAGEVVSDLKERPEGMRIKHRVNDNSVKMYDKQGSVLRIETTINNAHDMKAYRPKEGDEDGPKAWRYLRKGVADLHRRAQVSQQANARYADALATAEEKTPLGELTAKLCQPTTWNGKRVRALNPLGTDDAALLAAVNRGEFTLNGFRNRDLRSLLFGTKPLLEPEIRKQSAAVTRKLRLLRAHGLIQKVPKTHRYQVTPKGRSAITALLAARQADTAKLTQAA